MNPKNQNEKITMASHVKENLTGIASKDFDASKHKSVSNNQTINNTHLRKGTTATPLNNISKASHVKQDMTGIAKKAPIMDVKNYLSLDHRKYIDENIIKAKKTLTDFVTIDEDMSVDSAKTLISDINKNMQTNPKTSDTFKKSNLTSTMFLQQTAVRTIEPADNALFVVLNDKKGHIPSYELIEAKVEKTNNEQMNIVPHDKEFEPFKHDKTSHAKLDARAIPVKSPHHAVQAIEIMYDHQIAVVDRKLAYSNEKDPTRRMDKYANAMMTELQKNKDNTVYPGAYAKAHAESSLSTQQDLEKMQGIQDAPTKTKSKDTGLEL